MNSRERFDAFERDSKTIEAIASQYDRNSHQHAALKRAAMALAFVMTEGYTTFCQYVANIEGELTVEQRNHLAEMGIT